MSFIELNELDEVQEPEIMPDGTYDLVISSAETYENDNGRSVLKAIIDFQDHPDAASIFVFQSFPMDEDEPSTRKLMLLGVKRFLTLFGIDISGGFELDALPGATAVGANVYITQRDDTGDDVNAIKFPKLK